jgi:ankyrin repeat protein
MTLNACSADCLHYVTLFMYIYCRHVLILFLTSLFFRQLKANGSMSDSELISRCKERNLDAVRQLLAANANINASIDGESPLIIALHQNNTRLLDIVLQAGADTIRVPELGTTALMIAADCGSVKAVRCLLQHKPDLLDAHDDIGRTALFPALQNNNLEVASALLDAGASATILSRSRETTLMVCSDVATARRLLELGVDIRARDQSGKDALFHACMRDDVEMASFLLESGAERYYPFFGNTALHTACREGRTEVAALLLLPDRLPGDGDERQRKRWLHAFDDRMQTALHMAVQGGHVGCVQALVDAGFDVDDDDKYGHPALIYADDVEIVRILLDAGAEDCFQTLSSHACKDPARIDVLRLLLQRFPDSHLRSRSLLFFAVKAGNPEAVRLLLATQPPGYVNRKDSYDRTALFDCNTAGVMRLLLEMGAEPRRVNIFGQSPLMHARNTTCVRLLLEAAPDMVNKRDSRGWNAVMHLSCSDRHYEALEELFRYCEEHGVDADVNNKANNRATALHMAMERCNLHVVRLLLENGADALPSGDGGVTALMKPFLHGVSSNVRSPEMDAVDANMSVCLKVLMKAVLHKREAAA